MLELFGIPRAMLPPIADSDAIGAETKDGIRITAATGDQQASLFGLRCWEPGGRARLQPGDRVHERERWAAARDLVAAYRDRS